MIRMAMRRTCNFALCLLLMLGLAAVAEAAEIKENIAIQALPGEISALDPPYMLTSEDTAIGFNVYETLTRWDPDKKAVVPVLAIQWRWNRVDLHFASGRQVP